MIDNHVLKTMWEITSVQPDTSHRSRSWLNLVVRLKHHFVFFLLQLIAKHANRSVLVVLRMRLTSFTLLRWRYWVLIEPFPRSFSLRCPLVMVQQTPLAFHNFFVCEWWHVINRWVLGHSCLYLQELVLLRRRILWLSIFIVRPALFTSISIP